MAVQAIKRRVAQKRKGGGFLGALGNIGKLAAGTAAIIGSGGTAAPALSAIGGGITAAQGGLGLGKQLLDNKQAPAQGTFELKPQGRATTRRAQLFEEDPNSQLRQGLAALTEAPEDIRREAGPPIMMAMLKSVNQGGV
jgi:hypothetical protein